MYGLLNAALKEFVVYTYGNDTWQRVADCSRLEVPSFNKMAPYPDELTATLVGCTCEITARSFEDVMFGFGQFWVRYTDEQGYGPLFEIAGNSLHEFLLSLDTLHARVARSFPKLQPPSLLCDKLADGSLRMHYISGRKELCPIIPGILHGLSERFATELAVREEVCARRGAPHCEFLISFPKSDSA